MKITLSELKKMIRNELKIIKEAPVFGLQNAGDVVNLLSGMHLPSRGKDSRGRTRKGAIINDEDTFYLISSILSDASQVMYFIRAFKSMMGGVKVLDIVAPDGSFFTIDFEVGNRTG